jgi:hypothetical protein
MLAYKVFCLSDTRADALLDGLRVILCFAIFVGDLGRRPCRIAGDFGSEMSQSELEFNMKSESPLESLLNEL